VKHRGFWFVRLILIAASIALATVSASRRPAVYAQGHVAAHLPTDWSHRHVVFSAPGSTEQASMLQAEPRYWHQRFRRNTQTLQASDSQLRGLEQLDREAGDRDRDHHRRRTRKNRLHGDWGMSLGAGATGGDEMYPAKFTFDVNATPSCANDFVVFNTGVAGGVPTAAARTGTFTAVQPVAGNTVTVGGTEVLTASATLPATGTVTISAVPNSGDTVVIGSATYKYVTSLAGAYDIKIVAGSTSSSAASLQAAINANSTQCVPSGTCFGTNTFVNTSVTATRLGSVVTVTAITAGSGGNSIVFTTTGGARITLSPNTGTLSGGVTGSNAGTNFLIGASTTVTATNLALAIARNGGTVGVTATSSTRIVIVTATAAGPAGNSITLATNISATSFAWGGPTLAGGANAPGTIIAFNNLYSTQNGVTPAGLCGSAGPSALFSYNTDVGTNGTGTTTGATTSSPVLSLDGSMIAFVESGDPGGAILRLVKWDNDPPDIPPAPPDQVLPAGSSWTACTLPPPPNSCLIGLRFNNAAQATESAPFYVYGRDTLYVGDDTGKLHKFINVFGISGSTPGEVTTGGWPVTVNAAGNVHLHSPIYDSVSKNIFVGDLSGNFYYVREVGSSVGVCGSGSNGGVVPCLGTTNGLASGPTSIALGGVIDDAPIVDSTTQRVFFFDGSVNTTTCAAAGTNAILVQLDTQLTSATEVKVCFPNNGTTGILTNTKSGAFDNAYVSSAMGSKAGKLYFCARDTAFQDRPALFRIGFDTNGVMNSTVDANSGGSGNNYLELVNTSGEECSPITEIYNTPTSTDWIFVSVGNNGYLGTCLAANGGCLMSFNLTALGATWPPVNATGSYNLPLSGANPGDAGSSGIIVDNVSNAAQASSIYFTFLTTASTNATCNGGVSTGCAVKLTQAALQ
jgi:hypothetical protein